MTDLDKFIDKTYKELEQRIKEQESEFMAMFMDEYLGDFAIDDMRIKNTSINISKVGQIERQFDEAYDEFILPFLLWYGKKLVDGAEMAADYFKQQGENITKKDTAYVSAMIGLNGNKIVKGGYLWNLGRMTELRTNLQSMVMSAVVSGSKFNKFMANIKPVFKSTKKERSSLSKYYMKFAYNAVMQVINGTSYNLAKKFGYTHFVYTGGLIEKSRAFCRERDGNTYSIEEGQSWNNLDWNGKIEGVDFFVQIAGHNCRHHLQFIKQETN